jgi:hypothetical protein
LRSCKAGPARSRYEVCRWEENFDLEPSFAARQETRMKLVLEVLSESGLGAAHRSQRQNKAAATIATVRTPKQTLV